MFNYDWFHGVGLERQVEEARKRCAKVKFPDVDPDNGRVSKEYGEYRAALETRIILYLKDGLSYEMKEMVDLGTSSALAPWVRAVISTSTPSLFSGMKRFRRPISSSGPESASDGQIVEAWPVAATVHRSLQVLRLQTP